MRAFLTDPPSTPSAPDPAIEALESSLHRPPPPKGLPLGFLPLEDDAELDDYRRQTWAQVRREPEYRETIERQREVRRTESFVGGDPDDRIVGPGGGHSLQYRAATPSGEFGVPLDLVEAISQMRYLGVRSPIIEACSDLTGEYIGGDGVTFKAEDPEVQDILDAFKSDPANEGLFAVDEVAKRFRGDGSLVIPTNVLRTDDGVRVTCREWDPRDVVSVRFEDQNPAAPEYLRLAGANPPTPEETGDARATESHREMQLRYLTPGQRKRVTEAESRIGSRITEDLAAEGGSQVTSVWRVIRERNQPDADSAYFQPYRSRRQPGLLDGDVFWFRANRARGHLGLPDGLSVALLADHHDEIRAQAVRRVRVLNTYGLHFKLEGFSNHKLEEFKAAYKLPKAVGLWFSNEKSSIEPMTFNLGAADLEAICLGVKKVILAAYGFPPSFVAEDNATLATALAQHAPTLKRLQAKQAELRRAYEIIGRFVIDSWVQAGLLAPEKSRAFVVEMGALSEEQTETQAGTLNASALALAQMAELVPYEVRYQAAIAALLQAKLITPEQVPAEAPPEPTPEEPPAGPEVDKVIRQMEAATRRTRDAS